MAKRQAVQEYSPDCETTGPVRSRGWRQPLHSRSHPSMAGARTAADQRQGSLRHCGIGPQRTHPDVTEIFTGSPRLAGERKSALTPQALWQDLLGQHSPVDAAAAVEGDLRLPPRAPTAVSSWQWTGLRFEACATASTVAYSALQSGLMPWRARLGSSATRPFSVPHHHILPSPHTVFAGVQRLPPGHCAEFRDGKLHITRYWTPRFTPARPMWLTPEAAAGVAPRCRGQTDGWLQARLLPQWWCRQFHRGRNDGGARQRRDGNLLHRL